MVGVKMEARKSVATEKLHKELGRYSRLMTLNKKPKTKFYTRRWISNLKNHKSAHANVIRFLEKVASGKMDAPKLSRELRDLKKGLVLSSAKVVTGATAAGLFGFASIASILYSGAPSELDAKTAVTSAGAAAAFGTGSAMNYYLRKQTKKKYMRVWNLLSLDQEDRKKVAKNEIQLRKNEVRGISKRIRELTEHHQKKWGRWREFSTA